MADCMLLTAIKAKSTKLNLSSKKLDYVSPVIGQIKSIQDINLKWNQLTDLPDELAALDQLHSLNLGCNCFRHLPSVFAFVPSLRILHLFDNAIQQLNGTVLGSMSGLTTLNLNNNQIESLPAEVGRLINLEILSIESNQLRELPTEICFLTKLKELRIARNQINKLPRQMYFMKELRKFYAYKNNLEDLPNGLCKCLKLEVVDVSANKLRLFPAHLLRLRLKELYCEENNLLKHLPVHALQQEEILPLKEMAARLVIEKVRDPTSKIRDHIQFFPGLAETLAGADDCAVCGGPYLNTWLECVQFLDSRKVLKTKSNAGILPIRGILCSYTCFNAPNHDFYGIAQVENRAKSSGSSSKKTR